MTDAFLRAAQRAENDNIVAIFDEKKGVWITNSKTDAKSFHKVIVRPHYLCDCTGFLRTGMCKHVAATFNEQRKQQHIWICPNCGNVVYSRPAIPVQEYEFHIESKCNLNKEPRFDSRDDDENL